MASDDYRGFIEEVFIRPIRSVLIVDDQYPTWGQLLGPAPALNADRATDLTPPTTAFNRVRDMIDAFHHNNPPLLVDIHDGQDVPTDAATAATSRLHQTDLLILDYELDPARQGDGTRAIEILRVLLSNTHFNLIVVRTKEDLDSVFDSVRWGLLFPSMPDLSSDEAHTAKELIVDAEDLSVGFADRLYDAVGSQQYFHAVANPQTYLRTAAKAEPPYNHFADACFDGWANKDKKLVLRYLLVRLQRLRATEMAPAAHGPLSWSESMHRWVCADSAFIAFCDKERPTDILGDLHDALSDWKPDPSRLFLAKLRNVVDDEAVFAQSRAFDASHAMAYWYAELLRAPDLERRSNVARTVARHADVLLTRVLPHVESFADRLVASDRSQGQFHSLCERRFGVDLTRPKVRRRAVLEHNVLACSMAPVGWHLTVGHVFLMDDGYWLCLSPACDMVPGQIPKWRKDAYDNRLPFLAVRLERVNSEREHDAQTGRYIFLLLDGRIDVFSLSPQLNAAPQWHALFAAADGVFQESGFCFDVLRAEVRKPTFVIKRYPARVVGQLRYEYALSLAQRLGSSLTRIGLDFARHE